MSCPCDCMHSFWTQCFLLETMKGNLRPIRYVMRRSLTLSGHLSCSNRKHASPLSRWSEWGQHSRSRPLYHAYCCRKTLYSFGSFRKRQMCDCWENQINLSSLLTVTHFSFFFVLSDGQNNKLSARQQAVFCARYTCFPREMHTLSAAYIHIQALWITL